MRRCAGRNIYLVGLMGSGKSTIGRALSRRLGWKFIDTDRLIEKMAGRPIRNIFARNGEDAFRRLEKRAVAGAARKSGRVVAVGGGAVTNPKNVSVMKRTGIVVYLQVSVAAALRRAESEGIAKRPLLSGRSPKDRLRVLRSLLNRRRPLYLRCCDVRIQSRSHHPELIADRILRRLPAQGGTLRKCH